MFEREEKIYQERLPELLANEGKYAVIFGDKVLGVLDTRGDALTLGYAMCGLETQFMVKQIWAVEPVIRLREIE